MNTEQGKHLAEEKLSYLSNLIEEVESIIPALRCNVYARLEKECFEIVGLLGENIIELKKFQSGIQTDMDPLMRAKGIESSLKKYLNDHELIGFCRKKHKLFISHSTEDAEYVSALVQLFEYLGFTKETMFCSSYSGFDIPLDEDIYTYLKAQFCKYELYVILVLSNNYYLSAACLNEMGAAWVLSTRQSAILLPGFSFKEIKGAINPNKISIKMDQSDLIGLKYKLGQLRNKLLSEFELSNPNLDQWERKRDEFIKKVNELKKVNKGAKRKK